MPASWVRKSTQPHIKAHVPGIGLSDRFGYGYHWWTDASIPMYAALGSNGQSIFVVPDRDLVVVFTGAIGSSSGDTESERLFRSIVAACTPGA
jgi:CubicO group peptidase (beta-lactamase class C family)